MTRTFHAVSKLFAWIDGRYPRPPEASYPKKVITPLQIQQQEMSNWCWAAVASSISFHFDPLSCWTQVEIVANAFRYDPHSLPDESWNRAGDIGQALSLARCLDYRADRQIDFTDILTELNYDRPLCLEIHWGDGTGHAIIIVGCWLDANCNAYYRVADPFYNDDEEDLPPFRDLNRKRLENYLHTGKWRKTYFVRSPI